MSSKPSFPVLCVAWLLAAVVCWASAGCGQPGRGGLPVSGAVLLDGEPLAAGSIVFVPLDSGFKTAAEIREGRFELDARQGPAPGRYRVEVYAAEELAFALDDPLAFAASGWQTTPANAVAPQFNVRSELEASVVPGADDFTFEVTSGRQK